MIHDLHSKHFGEFGENTCPGLQSGQPQRIAGSLIMNFLLAEFFQTDQVSHDLLILRINQRRRDILGETSRGYSECQAVLKWMDLLLKSKHFLCKDLV